jgi:hypothetical protein
MGRRNTRRSKSPLVNTNGFISAVADDLQRLQRAVAYQTVKVNFTGYDVMRWLVSPEHLETLTAAWPLIKISDRTGFYDTVAFITVGGSPVNCHLQVDCNKLEVVAPDQCIIQPTWTGRAQNILRENGSPCAVTDALSALHNLYLEWVVVHEAIDWLDHYATVGASQYYFPTLTALLPNTHAIHNCGGQRFKEPDRPVGPMIPKFRRAAMTVASALLCPLEVPLRDLVQVQFTDGVPITFGLVA